MMFSHVTLILLIALSACLAGTLVYIVLSKHFTDRIVGVNLVSTLIINMILMLSLFLDQTAILDIDIVYALLSFQAVVVLSRILRVRMLAAVKQKEAGKK